ncbi:ATP synthase epsilon chain [bacterium BMS3Abin09]|nr:ATP synthase epsilon chain [bacterium BMS3Abin09]GBE41765.1 ATP synthase epsilon chain [bacterium BMS3Bbin09]HDN94860.1 F0F1 ATP synthase subunit epsilon [Nitrospirota bacterium]
MAETLTLDIVTPHGHIFTEEVDEVLAPGSEGEFGVLPDHSPFLTTLKIGILSYKKGSETGYFFINWGYAEVGPDKVTILADSAEKSDEIDPERAKEALKRAEERLKQATNVDEARATSAVARATARIGLVDTHVPR